MVIVSAVAELERNLRERKGELRRAKLAVRGP
jgi:hypothetical protein